MSIYAKNQTNSALFRTMLFSLFPGTVASTSVIVEPVKFLFSGFIDLFTLLPWDLKILCGVILGLMGVYIIIKLINFILDSERIRSFLFSLLIERFARRRMRPFAKEVSELVDDIGDFDYDIKIHMCSSKKCRYMRHIRDLEVDPGSVYGFCGGAEQRLSSPSGIYVCPDGVVLESGFKYNNLVNGYPLLDCNGRHEVVGRKIFFERTHRPTFVSWFYYTLFGIEPELVCVDPFFLKTLGDKKFESTNGPFTFAQKIRSGLRRDGTVFKTVVDFHHMDIVVQYREFVCLEGGGLYSGEFNTYLYWPTNELEEVVVEKFVLEMHSQGMLRRPDEGSVSRCDQKNETVKEEKKEAPEFSAEVSQPVVNEVHIEMEGVESEFENLRGDDEESEQEPLLGVSEDPPLLSSSTTVPTVVGQSPSVDVPSSVSPGVTNTSVPSVAPTPLTSKREDVNDNLIVVEPDVMFTREEAPMKVERMKEPLVIEAIQGLEIDGESDLRYDPDPSDVTFDHIRKKGKRSAQDKIRSRCVQYGLVYGSEGVIYNGGERTNVDALWKRVDKKVPEPSRCIDIDGARIEVNPQFFNFQDKLNFDPGHYISKDELFIDGSWIKDKQVNMNKRQKARLVKILNRVLHDGVYEWKANEKSVKVTYFPKPDELLAKAKPRVITFIPTVVWIRTVLILDEFLNTIKREDNEFQRMTFDVNGREVDIYWASGMDQDKLSKAATFAQRRLEEDGVPFFFVCGDDNTSHNFSVDFSSYDCTQSQYFFNLQAHLFLSRFAPGDRSKMWALVSEMFKFHSGSREDNYNYYFTKKVTLPSGAPWTLIFNTLGTIVYALLWVAVSDMMRSHRTHRGVMSARTMGKAMPIALKCLGLSATHSKNEEECSIVGVEFLKGVFVPHGDSRRGVRDLAWIPVDGRLFKAGKAIHESKDTMFSKAKLAARISSIANGYASFSLGPLMKAHVEVWANGKEKVVNPYTISSSDVHYEVDDNYWYEFYLRRYNITAAELKVMIAMIKNNGRSFASFTGGGWSRLVQVDYLGRSM